MRPFVHDGPPVRIVFGAGAVERLAAELERLGVRRPLVLSTPGQRSLAQQVARGLPTAGLFDGAVMHVPVEVAEAARKAAREAGADGCVAVGGGSTIGLGKAIALTSSLPVVAVPTTFSGSEMTPVFGLTEAGRKRTGRDPRVLPRLVIYDPSLSAELPPAVAGASGMNAIAHCVEALYARELSPIVALLAEEGIRVLSGALPRLAEAPEDLEARGEALYGACLAGTCLGAVGMALHHKLCHTLGGTFDLPHAATHAVVLPHAAAYNASAAADAMARVARALGGGDGPGGLYDLARRLGAPAGLQELGLPSSALEHAAALACQDPYWNPRPVERDAVLALLRDAHAGRRPGA
jgi:maleylacetate reductase